MKKFHYLLIGSLTLAAILACSKAAVKEPPTPYAQYQLGMQYFNNGDYLKAQRELQKIIYGYPGLAFIDTAQYYLATTYFDIKSYSEAIGEYRKLIQTYPTSPLAGRSQYQVAQAYFKQSPRYSLDQTDTYSAIDEFGAFLDKYPADPLADSARIQLAALNEKLATKLYKAGMLYLKLSDYDAALIYFGQVRDNYPDSKWASYAMYYSGETQMKQGHKEEALKTFQDFVLAFPDHKLIAKARKMITRLTPAQAGG